MWAGNVSCGKNLMYKLSPNPSDLARLLISPNKIQTLKNVLTLTFLTHIKFESFKILSSNQQSFWIQLLWKCWRMLNHPRFCQFFFSNLTKWSHWKIWPDFTWKITFKLVQKKTDTVDADLVSKILKIHLKCFKIFMKKADTVDPLKTLVSRPFNSK